MTRRENANQRLYDRCDTDELRSLIQGRTTEEVPEMERLCDQVQGRTSEEVPEMERLHYLHILLQLDEAWSFRFFDLPPELRTLVYRGLMVRDWCGKRFYAEILATCKLAHREAQSIIYTENVFKVTLVSACTQVEIAGGLDCSSGNLTFDDENSNGNKFGVAKCSSGPRTFFETSDRWPKYIRKIEALRLNLTLKRLDVPSPIAKSSHYEQTNHVLHMLSSPLTGALCLKRLEVVVTWVDDCNNKEDILRSVLYPIVHFQHLQPANVSFVGIPDNVAGYIRDSLRHRPASALHLDMRPPLREMIDGANDIKNRVVADGAETPVLDELRTCIVEAVKYTCLDEKCCDEQFYTGHEASARSLERCLNTPMLRDAARRLMEAEK